jgi:hypothetical protein
MLLIQQCLYIRGLPRHVATVDDHQLFSSLFASSALRLIHDLQIRREYRRRSNCGRDGLAQSVGDLGRVVLVDVRRWITKSCRLVEIMISKQLSG